MTSALNGEREVGEIRQHADKAAGEALSTIVSQRATITQLKKALRELYIEANNIIDWPNRKKLKYLINTALQEG